MRTPPRACATPQKPARSCLPSGSTPMSDLAEVEPVGDLELKGFAKPVPTLNLLALKEGAT